MTVQTKYFAVDRYFLTHPTVNRHPAKRPERYKNQKVPNESISC